MNSFILFTPHLFPLPKGEEGAVDWHLYPHQGEERAVERYLYPFPVEEERAVERHIYRLIQ